MRYIEKESNITKILREPGGFIEFGETTDRSFYLSWLESSLAGTGKLLVSKFVSEIGPGQEVYGFVTEEKTKEKLAELGLIDRALNENARVVVSETEILSSLKIVRVLQGGGVRVTMLHINPRLPINGEKGKVKVLFFGET